MRFTLPGIQKMDMGGEDSIRFIGKKVKRSKLKVKFETLLEDKTSEVLKEKKRIKQGDFSKNWMTLLVNQQQDSGLRRKDASNFPWMERKINNLQTFKKEEVLRKTHVSKDDGFIERLKDSSFPGKSKFRIFQKVVPLNSIDEIDKSGLENIYHVKLKDDELLLKQKISKIKTGYEKDLDENLFNDNLLKSKNEENKFIHLLKTEDEFFDSNNKKSEITNLNQDFNIEKILKSENLFNTGSELNSTDLLTNRLLSKEANIINPVIKHIITNISSIFSYSIDNILHSLDNLSFKTFENGFTFKLKLFPEELGELELHVKKEGINLSMVAYVMNEEAKQVMMHDIENLSNFFMNQGYNLNQIMVEVKNENGNNSFDNFEKVLAENNYNIISDKNLNESTEKNIHENIYRRYSYYKGLGRLINKYI